MVIPSVTVYDRVDAFLARKDELTRDEIREWLPYLREQLQILSEPYEKVVMGTHARPDPEIARRRNGLLELIGKAELVGVYDRASGELSDYPIREDEWVLYGPAD